MNSKLMFIGFGATLAILLCCGSGETTPPQTSNSDGRYRMFSPSPASGVPETYVIDTQSGRLWKQTFYTDIRGFYMVPQPYLTADGLAASAIPTDGVTLESLSMQNRYDSEVEKARQKKPENKQ